MHIPTHTTQKSSIRSDEGLTLEMSALKLFCSGQITVKTHAAKKITRKNTASSARNAVASVTSAPGAAGRLDVSSSSGTR